MAGWTGFSDEELARIKGVPESTPAMQQKRRPTRATTQRTRQQQQRDKLIQEKIAEINHGNSNGKLDSIPSKNDVKLAIRKEPTKVPKVKTPSPQTKKKVTFQLPEDGRQESKTAGGDTAMSETTEEVKTSSEPSQEEKEPEMITDDKEVEKREYSKLELIQKQQKEIEELNRRKKLLLSKAIADRKKRTQQEAARLAVIQKELEKMDHLLNVDVSILRDKIDDVSREYSDARRRLQKAEEEYVQAKMDFHNKSEMKEQLTEHLYSIIQQNELRKSKKLAELMERMEMVQAEEEELPPMEELHPPTIHPELHLPTSHAELHPPTSHPELHPPSIHPELHPPASHPELHPPTSHPEVTPPVIPRDGGKSEQKTMADLDSEQQAAATSEKRTEKTPDGDNSSEKSTEQSLGNSKTPDVSGSETVEDTSKGTSNKPETNTGEEKNNTDTPSPEKCGDTERQSSGDLEDKRTGNISEEGKEEGKKPSAGKEQTSQQQQ